MTYFIENWDNFEIAESRRYKKNKWLPLPNKMDNLAYKRLTKNPKKHEIFSAWILLLQLASKMPERGVLKNDLGDLDFDDMELITGFPAKTFEMAILFLKSPKIKWMGQLGEATGNPRVLPEHPTTTLHNSTEQNKTEQNNIVGEIVDHFNLICGTNYKKTTSSTNKLIQARQNEGFTVDQFKIVINKMFGLWKNNPDMSKYIRPETLFGTKFEGYLNQVDKNKVQTYTDDQLSKLTDNDFYNGDGNFISKEKEELYRRWERLTFEAQND